jgi:hypothetical protein
MTTATATEVNVPLLDLKAQYATIRQEVEPAVLEVPAAGRAGARHVLLRGPRNTRAAGRGARCTPDQLLRRHRWPF